MKERKYQLLVAIFDVLPITDHLTILTKAGCSTRLFMCCDIVCFIHRCRRAGAMICKKGNEVNGVKEILKEEKQLFHL